MEQSLNSFITDIYGTVMDAGNWTNILDTTAQIAGAKAANICLVDHVAVELNSQFMCPETTRFYPTYINTPHMETELKAVARIPQVLSTAEFLETGEYVKQANVAFKDDPIDIQASEDWLFEEWSVRHRHISRLNIQPSYLDMLTLLFSEQPESERAQGLSIIQPLLPHFAKAIEISRPFLLLQSRFQATMEVLNRFHLAVFILSADGTVVSSNNAAKRILDLSDAVSLDARGKLKSSHTSDSQNLEHQISQLLQGQRKGEFENSTELVLPRRSERNPYLVEISPLSEPTVIGQISGLMIVMIDPDHRKIVNTSGIGRMFGLSKAEDHIYQLLVDGLSTQEIAEARNVSPITVKNQIKSLLSKTGNRNRSDLIRQALNINLPVDQATAVGQ